MGMGKGMGQLHTATSKCLASPFPYGHFKLILLIDHRSFGQTSYCYSRSLSKLFPVTGASFIFPSLLLLSLPLTSQGSIPLERGNNF